MGKTVKELEGEILQSLLDLRLMTQPELARILSVSDDVVSNMVRGVTRIRPDRKALIAAALNVPVSELSYSTSKTLAVSEDPESAPSVAREVSNASGYTKNLKPLPNRKIKIYGTISAGDGNAIQPHFRRLGCSGGE